MVAIRRALPAALLVAGCFSPTVEEGAACSPEGECPPGQTCAADGRCYGDQPSFRFRRRIDLHPLSVTGVLRDFSLAVVLTGDEALAAHARDDGLDLRFTDADGETPLAFEVESFDRAAGDLTAWVRVPLLSLEDTIYLHYGGEPIDRPAASAVWDERYLAVWHGAGGDASLLADSTDHHNDGQSGEGQAPERVAGVVGSALSFDGADDQVLVDEAVPLVELGDSTNLVISMWVRATADTADGAAALGRGAQSGSEPGFGVLLGRTTWSLRLRATGSGDTSFAAFGDGTALVDRWVMLGALITRESGGIASFDVVTTVDGEEVGSGYWQCDIGPCDLDLGGPLYLSHPDAPYAGLVDEVRIVDRTVGPENLRAEFENLANPETFYSVGEEETLPL